MSNKVSEDTDKTIGIVAYVTLIGFIIAAVMNNDKKGDEKSFGAFHLRQSLGIIIAAIGTMIGLAILTAILAAISWSLGATVAGILYPLMYLGILAFVIIGIINASNGEKKPLPLIGPFIEKILKSTFE
jgi:uncharacterized membrane protein